MKIDDFLIFYYQNLIDILILTNLCFFKNLIDILIFLLNFYQKLIKIEFVGFYPDLKKC